MKITLDQAPSFPLPVLSLLGAVYGYWELYMELESVKGYKKLYSGTMSLGILGAV